MSEQSLVTNLINSDVRFPWRTRNEISFTTEVKVTANRVDVVFFEKKSDNEIGFIAAVEAKITDWRSALRQAHRDKLFADRAYVVLPEKFSPAAVSNLAEFRRAAVGLITIGDKGIKTYYHPPINNYRSSQHVDRVKRILMSVCC